MQTASINPRLLSIKQVEDMTSLKKSRLYQLVHLGQFVQPVKLGRRTAFSQAEVEGWILRQLATRSEK